MLRGGWRTGILKKVVWQNAAPGIFSSRHFFTAQDSVGSSGVNSWEPISTSPQASTLGNRFQPHIMPQLSETVFDLTSCLWFR